MEEERRPLASPRKQPLFRQAAIDAAAGSQFGEPLRTDWVGTSVSALIGLLLVAGLFVLGGLVEYSPVHRVTAFVDAPLGVIRLRAPSDGLVVTKLGVVEGDIVSKGSVLVQLGADKVGARGQSRQRTQQQYLGIEQEAIEREIAAARQEAEAQIIQIDRRVAGLRAELDSLEREAEASENLLSSLRQQAAQADRLAEQGFVTQVHAAQRRDEVNGQLGRLELSRASIARLRREIDQAPSERRLIEARLRGALESRRRQLSRVQGETAQEEFVAEQSIRAPSDGVISAALVAEGQSLALGQTLFTITPVAEPLVLRAFVPTRAVGSIRVGGGVGVALLAYPPEKFGFFEARVLSVGAAPMLPGEHALPTGLQEPHYLVSVQFVAPPRGPRGEALALKPGMAAQVRVAVESRSLLEWLFAPLLRALHGAPAQAAAPQR